MGSSGAPVTIQAGLTRQSDSSPVSGATLAFGVGGTAVGSAVTNGAGVASLAYAVPPELGVGNGYYHIRAEFTGDAAYLGSVGSAPFISLPYSVDGQVTWNGAGLEWVTVTLEGETHIATYEASSSGRSVPDLGTVTSQIPMTWQGQIESVRVQVNMNHTYASDLRISVIHPDGTTVVLHDRGGWSLDYARSVYPDVVAPVQSLAAFTGKTANGTWTLKIEDMAAGDTGYLNSWYLAVTLRQTNPYDTSRSSGNYFFSPGAGTYTLRPWRDGYVFTPESRTVTVGPEQHNLDFVARVLTVLEANDAEGQSGSSVGLSARLTARGGWVADRTVTFTVDGSEAGGAVTDATGVATLAYEIPLSKGEGAYALGAAFAGDTAYVGSSDTATLTVLPPSDTTLYTIDRAGTITGLVILRQYDLKRLSDNAMLEGKTISFKIDGSEIGTSVTNAGGDSTLDWTITDGPATRTITAAFAGDAAYNGCSDDATLTCETWATKMSGVNREGKITAYRILKAWLWKMDNSPIPGKSIAFKLDGTLLGTDATRPTGVAQIGYTIADGAGAGARTILAEWAGDGGYLPSSCTNTLTVLKATPYIWVMPRSVPAGGVARFYAYFRRLADYQKQEAKTVTFKVDGTWVADVVTGSGADAGIARYSYTTIEPPGAHTIRCEFAGDAWVDAGYGEANLTIY
jgi:subtilisin-like proprotein convertase family protein